ncbi:MAG TPA: hypothetical protein VK470_10720 [Bacteroidota bacterium]|nr:hypothetical protein [Bacteroidota bacterium]
MRHVLMILSMALLLVRGTAVLAQSDSEIKQNFENRHAELLKAAEAATTTEQIKKVQADIDAFEKEFESHKAFLDKALYPDDFTKSLENLRSRVSYTAKQTEAVETQSARATQLEGQVKTLTEQVDKLTSENSSILEQLHALEADRVKDKKQIEQLRGLVAKLQKNIADRDNMIFNLADSLFLQFDKPTMTPADERQKMVAFEKNNILSSVKRAISDNMTFLQSTALSGEDVVRLKEEQRKFAGHWKGVGPKLAQIYLPVKEKERQMPQIDSMIAEWGRKADRVFWKALNDEFTQHNLLVQPFTNGESFYQNVTRYIDNQTNNVDNQKDDARYAAYSTFADTVWEKRIDPVWLPLLKREGMITENQAGDIKAKMDIWKSKVKSSNYLIYIIILGVVVIAAMIIFSRMNRGRKTPVPASAP